LRVEAVNPFIVASNIYKTVCYSGRRNYGYISITIEAIPPRVTQKKIKYQTTKKRNLLLRRK